MPQIQIPRSFFTKERETIYSRWRYACIRELGTNSLDAGATRIDITLRDGCLEFVDNGMGMTRAVLDNVYFKLGESTKSGECTGGFGRARILTNFSMERYTIHTQDWLVRGSGATYDIDETKFYKGCVQTLYDKEITLDSFETEAKCWIQRCNIKNCQFFINGRLIDQSGEKMEAWEDLMHDGAVIGEICRNVGKSNDPHYTLIRVNGVHMYEIWNGSFPIIIELDPKRSREFLTANRDGLRGNAKEAIDRFHRKISTENVAAFRKKKIEIKRMYAGTGKKNFQGERAEEADRLAKKMGLEMTRVTHSDSEEHGQMTGLARVLEQMSSAPSLRANREFDGEMTEGVMNQLIQALLPDIGWYQCQDKSDIMWWEPSRWEVKRKPNGKVSFGQFIPQVRLLQAWTECVEEAMICLQSITKAKNVAWSPGFVFRDETHAFMAMTEDRAIFYINPLIKPWSVMSKRSAKYLMAAAKHEVAHITDSGHDENFACMLTEIDALYNEDNVWTRITKSRVE